MIEQNNPNEPKYWNQRWKIDSIITNRTYPRILQKINELIKEPSSIIDIGCGKGYFCYELKFKGHKTFGIDFSDYAIDWANKVFDVKAKKYDIRKEEIPYNNFDYLICNEVLEHFEYPEEVIKNFYKCSKRAIYFVPDTSKSDKLTKEKFKEHLFNFTPSNLKQIMKKFYLDVEVEQFNEGDMQTIMAKCQYPKEYDGL